MTDRYDDEYPEEVAGHVEIGAFMTSGMIQTTRGADVNFSGAHLVEDHDPRIPDGVGAEHVNRMIAEAVRHSKEERKRQPVASVGDEWIPRTYNVPDSAAHRIIIRNPRRKSVTLVNQGTTSISIGRDSGISVGGMNTVLIPAGASRSFEHTGEIWAVGSAGGILDSVETNFHNE